MKKKTWHQILAGNVARKCFLKCDIKAFIKTLSNWVIIWQWWNYEWFIFSSLYSSVFSKIDNEYKLLLWSGKKLQILKRWKEKDTREFNLWLTQSCTISKQTKLCLEKVLERKKYQQSFSQWMILSDFLFFKFSIMDMWYFH